MSRHRARNGAWRSWSEVRKNEQFRFRIRRGAPTPRRGAPLPISGGPPASLAGSRADSVVGFPQAPTKEGSALSGLSCRAGSPSRGLGCDVQDSSRFCQPAVIHPSGRYEYRGSRRHCESLGGYVNRCVNDIRRRPSQPLSQRRSHPRIERRDRRLRSTQGPSDA